MNINRSGAFETSDKGLAMLDNGGFVSGLSIMEADYGMDLFTPFFMGHAKDRDLEYTGMVGNYVFDFGGIDIENIDNFKDNLSYSLKE